MNPDVLHFQCAACQATLTVPVHLAGITGPCPKCGATVTSPQAPAPEPLGVPPVPSMTPPLHQPMPQSMQEPVPETVATIHQPQSHLPPTTQPQAAMGSWGGQELSQPQQPMAQMLAPQPEPAAPAAPEIPSGPTMLPPRRVPGQAPAVGSLMNQQGMGAGFGPVASGLASPSPAPQWSLPTAPELSPMPKREVEDPMTTILRGAGVPATSELESEPRNLAAPAAPAPPPVSMPREAMNVQLGGGRRRGGKMIATLAAVLVLGAIGAAGWYFLEPLKELAGRVIPSSLGGTTKEPPLAPDAGVPVTADAAAAPQVPGDKSPFDPLAKPAQGLPVEKPAPIVVENPSIGIAGTPAPAVPNVGAPVLGGAESQFATTPEIKSAAPGPPVPMPVVPVAPKATIVEEGTEGSASPNARHVPGTALGKKGAASDSLIEVAPANPPASSSSGAGLQTATKSTDTTKTVVVQATPEAKRAAEALQAFFAAKNLGERMPLTLGAENMKSLMERYYAKKDSGVIDVDEIKLLRFDPAPDTGGGPHCVFTVASKLWEYPIPVMLQEESGSYKVDWLAFVEFRDNLLFEFLSDFQEMPARFHVGIRRTHYFEDDVPDLQEKDCFEIQPPLPTYVGYVFVPKGTPLAADLASRISWETLTAYVIVELRWRRLGEMKWVELTAVPQLNWYSFPQPVQAGSAPISKPAPAEKKGAGGVDIKKSK